MKTLVFILSAVIIVLLFIILASSQGDKEIDKTISDLKQKNDELENAREDAEKTSLAQRLGTAGIETLNLWKFEIENCEIPYCLATRIGVEGVEDFVEQTRGLSRWKGYVTKLEEGPEDPDGQEGSQTKTTTCEAFSIDGGADFPINMDLLADVEKKLLKAGTEKNQIEITVYSIVTGGEPISCKTPAYVLNVHL